VLKYFCFWIICHDVADHGKYYSDDGDIEGDSVYSDSDVRSSFVFLYSHSPVCVFIRLSCGMLFLFLVYRVWNIDQETLS
jgi:hypothetical protein